MRGWSKHQYDADQDDKARKRKESQPKPWHWLGQADPVARFTAWLAVFTLLLILVSAAQSWTVYKQLKETISEQRPYIFLKKNIDISDVNGVVKNNGDVEFSFNVTWANSGNSPANVSFLGSGGDDVYFRYTKSYGSAEWVVGPKSEFVHKVFFQYASQIRSHYIVPNRLFKILGWARYRDDVERKIRNTRFCILIDNLNLSADDKRITGDPVPCHEPGTNCTDEDCPKIPWPDEAGE